MEVLLVVVPFLVFGIAVLFIAFSGGPAAAREAYLTRGGRFIKVAIPLLYVALGIAVPAAVIASRGEAEGGVGALRSESISAKDEYGKKLFSRPARVATTWTPSRPTGTPVPTSTRWAWTSSGS